MVEDRTCLLSAPKVRVTAVLIEKGHILLIEQRVTGSRNWSLPGGALEAGETIGQCLCREVREETGLEVAPERLLYICDRIEESQIVHITFLVKRVGGRLTLGAEPEPTAQPIHDVQMVLLERLMAYGFSSRFVELARAGFPEAGSYQGLVESIGL